MIDSVVWTQYTNVTLTDTQPRRQSSSRFNALRRAVITNEQITLLTAQSVIKCDLSLTSLCTMLHKIDLRKNSQI